MSVVLYHHPYTRASTAVWMLEEVGIDYELRYLELQKGEHKQPEFLAINPMGKLPALTDGDIVVTESAAIGLYLADRYAAGTLAPTMDDPRRGVYLRWSVFPASVIEPGVTAKMSGWEFKEAQAGWGNYQAMLRAIESAIGDGPFVLGEQFTMADIIFGGTLRFMLGFKLVEPRDSFVAYADRLASREAWKRAEAKNEAIREERGIPAR